MFLCGYLGAAVETQRNSTYSQLQVVPHSTLFAYSLPSSHWVEDHMDFPACSLLLGDNLIYPRVSGCPDIISSVAHTESSRKLTRRKSLALQFPFRVWVSDMMLVAQELNSELLGGEGCAQLTGCSHRADIPELCLLAFGPKLSESVYSGVQSSPKPKPHALLVQVGKISSSLWYSKCGLSTISWGYCQHDGASPLSLSTKSTWWLVHMAS